MMFPMEPDEDAPDSDWRAWLKYLRTLTSCSPSVTFAIEYAAKVLQERQGALLNPPPLTSSEAGANARGG